MYTPHATAPGRESGGLKTPNPEQADPEGKARLAAELAAQQAAQGYKAQGELSAQQAAQALKALQEQQGFAAGQSKNQYAAEQELAKQQAGYGSGAMSQQAGIETEARNQQAALQAAAEQRRQAQLKELFASMSGGGAGGAVPSLQYGGPQYDAARAAAFGRAKDTMGDIAKAKLTSLHEATAGRGISGGGLEGSMIAGDVINPAAGGLNELTREQYIQDLGNAQETARMNYQGGIQQRGQNMSTLPALLSLITARGIY
jgi:hypothetical protein